MWLSFKAARSTLEKHRLPGCLNKRMATRYMREPEQHFRVFAPGALPASQTRQMNGMIERAALCILLESG
jgi:hypothetical protein